MVAVLEKVDDDLALFRDLSARYDGKDDIYLLRSGSGGEFEALFGLFHPGSSHITDVSPSPMVQKKHVDEFLNSGNHKSDYDWLLTPPATPLYSSSEKGPDVMINREGNCFLFLENGVANSKVEISTNSKARQDSTQLSPTIISTTFRRPLSSGEQAAAAKAIISSTPARKPTFPITTASKASKPLRTSSPTVKSSSKPKTASPPFRSSTPSRSIARTSTPTANTTKRSFPASNPATRSSAPSHWLSTPSSALTSRSSSVTKLASTTAKSSVTSSGVSPSIRSRSLTATKMPGSSSNALPNQMTALPNRPASASRCTPVADSGRRSATETCSTTQVQRRLSCSPSRRQKTVGNGLNHRSPVSASSTNRGRYSLVSEDSPYPVLVGSKVVEGVISTRRLGLSKQVNSMSSASNSSGRKYTWTNNSSGFGNSLSKKSDLHMAARHRDIEQSMRGKLRPLVTNIPASSPHSMRRKGL